MKLSTIGLATSAFFLLSSAQVFAATVIFDDFTINQTAVDQPYPGATSSNSVAFGAGTRTLTALNTASNGDPVGATTIQAVGGALNFSNNVKAAGVGTVTYTKVGDISSGANPYFFFDVGVFDNVANFLASATDTLGHTSTYQEVLQAGFSPFLFFSQFVGTADFNSLSTLSFAIDTNNVPGHGRVLNVDGSLNSISLNAPSEVPLPAGGLLLLLGLGGLAALRRKTNA
jgi:hypothetical protein